MTEEEALTFWRAKAQVDREERERDWKEMAERSSELSKRMDKWEQEKKEKRAAVESSTGDKEPQRVNLWSRIFRGLS